MSDSEKLGDNLNYSNWKGPEFLLVISMLIVLTGLIFIVLIIPVQFSATPDTDRLTQILKFRQEILTVIVTAFSAWIGAGAAYFFGRENMREVTRGMLQMRELPPREKLRHITLKDLPPRPITWKVKISDPLLNVYNKLIKDVSWWFIVITNDDGILETVIEEEAMWRYINYLATEGKKPVDILTEKEPTVKTLLNFLNDPTNKELAKKTVGIYIRVTNDYTLGAVNDLMLDKGVYLSIITDESMKPVSYVSSDDIRKEFLKMS